jgi:hypothetical protein
MYVKAKNEKGKLTNNDKDKSNVIKVRNSVVLNLEKI